MTDRIFHIFAYLLKPPTVILSLDCITTIGRGIDGIPTVLLFNETVMEPTGCLFHFISPKLMTAICPIVGHICT